MHAGRQVRVMAGRQAGGGNGGVHACMHAGEGHGGHASMQVRGVGGMPAGTHLSSC